MNEQHVLDIASLLLDAATIQDAIGNEEKATESREFAHMLVSGLDYLRPAGGVFPYQRPGDQDHADLKP